MSTELWENEEGLPSGTRFCCGEGKMCIQLTDNNGYVIISYDKLHKLIKKLEKELKYYGKRT